MMAGSHSFGRGHGADDRLDLADLAVVDGPAACLHLLGHAGHQTQSMPESEPIFFTCEAARGNPPG